VIEAKHGELQVKQPAHAFARGCRVVMKFCRDELQLSFAVHQQIRTKEHPRRAGKQEAIVNIFRSRRVNRLQTAMLTAGDIWP
jgi:hypothetical protein